MSEPQHLKVKGALEGLMRAWETADARRITALQRVLLVTDGTLTAALEAAFLETICLQKLSQSRVLLGESGWAGSAGGTGLRRIVLLVGEQSKRVYAHAESLIALEELSPAFQEALLSSDNPIGSLWVTHKMELYKEFLELRSDQAGDLAEYFSCSREEPLFRRRYCVYLAGRPLTMITEHLPLYEA